ncbi:MAG TPA: hypothetical protein PKA59_04135, partial [Chakrabartia sp.]|nr:hypothetical protein [Chakrabartia sp.]
MVGTSLPVAALLNMGMSSAAMAATAPPVTPALLGAFSTPAGSATRTSVKVGGVTTDTVTVSAPKTVINWTPLDTSTDTNLGAIDFLKAGDAGIFQGVGNFTVLNRIIPVSATGGANARMIGLNGRIEANIVTVDGNPNGKGNIWFYSPNGIIAGGTSAFNVGGLVLTSLDPFDPVSGTFTDIVGGTSHFGYGTPNPNSLVSIKTGADIVSSSYTAILAPRIEQGGGITTNLGAALAAGEGIDLRFYPTGLFDVSVTIGTTDRNGIVHSGTTGGPSRDPGKLPSGAIMMAAVPKNDAITMLLSGNIGFAASNATSTNGVIVLMGGESFTGGQFIDSSGGFKSDIRVNPEAGGVNFTSSLVALAQGEFDVIGTSTGAVTFQQQVTLITDKAINITARDGQSVSFLDGATFSSRVGNDGGTISFSAIDDPAVAGTPGSISVTGNLTLVANGATSGLGSTSGGTIDFNVAGGTINISDTLNINVSGVGESGLVFPLQTLSGGPGTPVIGRGTGGTVNLNLGSGTFSANNIIINASGTGGTFAGLTGGAGTGGTVNLTKTGTGALNLNTVSLNVSGQGGAGGDNTAGAGGTGGIGQAGTVNLRVQAGSLGATTINLLARGVGGTGGTGTTLGGVGGAGLGGGVLFKIGADPTVGSLTIDTSGVGGVGGNGATGGAGGAGTGGSGASGARLDLSADVLTVTTDLNVLSQGTGGAGGVGSAGSGGAGGTGTGGLASVSVQGTATELRPGTMTVSAAAAGGNGGVSTSSGVTAYAGAVGGSAAGGSALVSAATGGRIV